MFMPQSGIDFHFGLESHRVFALSNFTVWKQHSSQHHKGTAMQMQLALL